MKRRIIPTALAVGATVISLYAGWGFYVNYVARETAFLIVTVFEAGRLSALYYCIFRKNQTLWIAYALIAGMCAVPAWVSITAEMITSELNENRQYESAVYSIKKAALKLHSEKIAGLERELAGAEQKKGVAIAGVERNSGNRYAARWKGERKRFAAAAQRIQNEIAEAKSELEAAINHIPGNPRQWCETSAARYGVKVNLPINKTSVVSSVIIDTMGMREETVKAMLAACLVSVVELCIILFSFLANRKAEDSESTAGKSEPVSEISGLAAKKSGGLRPGKKEDFKYYCDICQAGTDNPKQYSGHCGRHRAKN